MMILGSDYQTIWRLTIDYFMEEQKMVNVVIDYLSFPLALRSITMNLHFDMPSIMLISPVGISKRSENQSTNQDEHSSFVKGHFFWI